MCLRTILAGLIIFTFLSSTIYSKDNIDYTGTFSNLTFNEEGGDLVGVEVKIVYTSRYGYQAAVQFAEGGAGELIIVNVKVKDENVEFEITKPDTYAGAFNGTISSNGLKGTFRYKNGGLKIKWDLPRKASYWD